jgi:sensor histidine kinase YesM
VGLANIRDRLAQAYGARQSFDAAPSPTGGFVVTIEVPFETETKEYA